MRELHIIKLDILEMLEIAGPEHISVAVAGSEKNNQDLATFS
jgi:hypothetical protein